jgi:hypothetical protein
MINSVYAYVGMYYSVELSVSLYEYVIKSSLSNGFWVAAQCLLCQIIILMACKLPRQSAVFVSYFRNVV